MTISAHIARIENDPARGILIALWFPFVLVGWLLTVLLHDPRQLITARPYALAFAMFLCTVDGAFVGEQ